MSKKYEVATFSYLAVARILQIDKYPEPNDGAEINAVIDTIAADGPIVAAILAQLGIKSYLLTNSLGIDSDARKAIKHLNTARVHHEIKTRPETRTPFIVITSDKEGNRDWFSYTREAVHDLEEAELSVLESAKLVYIDLYSGIAKASLRVLSYCLANDLPVFLNISSSVSDEKLLSSVDLKGVGILQASISDDTFEQSELWAQLLFTRCHSKVSVITAGAHGATAYDGKTFYHAGAHPIQPLHVHGAGAAFSAGFLTQHLDGKSLQDCLDFGCAIGSLSCIKERIFEEISLLVIKSFIENSQ